jgi:hypothetical protein
MNQWSPGKRTFSSRTKAASLYTEASTLPSWLTFRTQDCGHWRLLLGIDSFGLSMMAGRCDWSFSYIAAPAVARAFHLNGATALDRALMKLMKAVAREGFNAFEITHVHNHRVLAIHSSTMVASPRQLRSSPFLRDLDPNYYPRVVEVPEAIYWRASEVQPQIKGI